VVERLTPAERQQLLRYEQAIADALRAKPIAEEAARQIVARRLYREAGSVQTYIAGLARRTGKSARTLFRWAQVEQIKNTLALPDDVHPPGKLSGAVLVEIDSIPEAERGDVLRKAQKMAYGRPKARPGSPGAEFAVHGQITLRDVQRAAGRSVTPTPHKRGGSATDICQQDEPPHPAGVFIAPEATATVTQVTVHELSPLCIRIALMITDYSGADPRAFTGALFLKAAEVAGSGASLTLDFPRPIFEELDMDNLPSSSVPPERYREEDGGHE
jgi:hypothetical protein